MKSVLRLALAALWATLPATGFIVLFAAVNAAPDWAVAPLAAITAVQALVAFVWVWAARSVLAPEEVPLVYAALPPVLSGVALAFVVAPTAGGTR